jgi:hypothetical protein
VARVAEAAETFQRRIFIAGDAAHTMPPTGGFGGNTGIQDAHNLAWKLALVLAGKAGSALVDTYDQERQPAGMQAIEQAYNRYVLRSDPDLGTEGMHEAIPDMHVEFNRYRSTAVVADPGYVDDGVLDIDPRQSHGLPGTRAPHVELSGQGKILSTLDLYVGDFVLMAGPDGAAWADAWRLPSQRWASRCCRTRLGEVRIRARPQRWSTILPMPRPHRSGPPMASVHRALRWFGRTGTWPGGRTHTLTTPLSD